MLVEIETFLLALLRNSKQAKCVNGIHQDEGHNEGRRGDDQAPQSLCDQNLESATIEKTFERRRVVSGKLTGGTELSGGKEAQRKGTPDAADAVNRNCAH